MAQQRMEGSDIVKSILDPSFKYTSSANTDIAKTFAKVRRELRAQEQERLAREAEVAQKVQAIRKASA